MTYLDRIHEGTRHDPARFVPLRADGERIGRVRRDRVARLLAFEDVFVPDGEGLALAPALSGGENRTAAFAAVVEALSREGLLREDCTERFGVVDAVGETPRFLVPRCAVSFFGIRAFGVHVNGTVETEGALRLWVARRTDKVRVEPFKLDHLVAGGQPAGLSLGENLEKEAWEEAGIPATLAARAVPTGLVGYACEAPDGLRDEVLYTYDLPLPPDFVPENRDGELDDFALWDVDRLRRTLRDTNAFKTNVALVNIDFLMRRGLIGPEEPDYVRIARGLRSC